MSLCKVEVKVKNNSRKSATPENDKMRRSEELLREVDSLALLLEEVRRQSARIQAAADAIGDELFEDFPVKKVNANGSAKHDRSIGPRLVTRSRSTDHISVSARNTAMS